MDKTKRRKKTVFEVTEKGKKRFKEVFDIDIDDIFRGE
jgi:DNA-binding PadR family transcriptional regulator